MKKSPFAAPYGSFRRIIAFLAMIVFSVLSTQAMASDEEGSGKFNAGEMIMHHISDGHSIHLLGLTIPLPCIVKTDKGLDFFMSSVFMDEHHGFTKSYTSSSTGNTYQLIHEKIVVVNDHSSGPHEIAAEHGVGEAGESMSENVGEALVGHDSTSVPAAENLETGESHGTPVMDFSITKSVMGMFVMLALVLWMFISMARAYRKRRGMAPKGMQNLLEPFVLFIRDEVAIPSLGKKRAGQFLPFLLTVFFFIWACNLLGLIPFLGGFNITGTLSITLVLAAIVFIMTTINGNKHYWGHIVWPPGVPFLVKLILVPIEILSVFMKPTVLMIRLTANINAGHIVILAFTSLIFIFAEKSAGAGYGVGIASTAFMIFMYFIELLVGFLQAYVFTLLAALYFGDATQEHYHPETEIH